MLTAVLKNKFNVSIYYNFRQTLVPYGYSRGSHFTRALVEHTLFLQPVKPMAVYMYMVGVRVSIWVRFRVCHDMFRTRSSMFDSLRK